MNLRKFYAEISHSWCVVARVRKNSRNRRSRDFRDFGSLPLFL